MYALEALSLNKTELISLNHPWIRSFEKLFTTFSPDVVKQCQLFNGYFNIIQYHALKSMNFLNKLSSLSNILVKTIYLSAGRSDLYRLSNLFNSQPDVFAVSYTEIVREHFERDGGA